jgi:hypothetical protein
MFWTSNLGIDILAPGLATFPNIGRIFVHFSGHSDYFGIMLETNLFNLLKGWITYATFVLGRSFVMNKSSQTCRI